MSISSDEVNFLIYRYLQENGFTHSAFTFAYESLVIKSSTAQTEIPPGALITFLQKGLEYVAIEEHINEDGTIQEFENNFSLLSPLICEAVAVKEDRRVRKTTPATAPVGTASATEQVNGAGSKSALTKRNLAAASSSDMVSMQETGETSQTTDTPGTTQANGTYSEDGTANRQGLVTTSSLNLINNNGSRYLQLNGHQGEVFMCLWNPVQCQLASGSADGMCRLWSLWEMSPSTWESKDKEVKLPTTIMPHILNEGEKYRDVTSVTWSPDGAFLATGCYDGLARIWDNNGKLVTLLKEHAGPVFSLKWNKSGDFILSGSYDRRAIVWCAKTGVMVRSFLLHSGPVLDVDWKDNEVFATCSSDKSIFICRVSAAETNQAERQLLGHQDEVNAVCWSPGGMYLASCSDDSTAKVWSLEDGLKHDLLGHTKEIFTLRWTSTGTGSANPNSPLLLCTASFDGTVKVWSGETGLMVYNLCKQVQPVYSLAPSPNGELIATGSLGGNVSIWSIEKGKLLRELHGVGDTFDVSWSADGSLLCACFSSGQLYVLDATTLSTTSTDAPTSSSNGAAGSADSSVTSQGTFPVDLKSAETGEDTVTCDSAADRMEVVDTKTEVKGRDDNRGDTVETKKYSSTTIDQSDNENLLTGEEKCENSPSLTVAKIESSPTVAVDDGNNQRAEREVPEDQTDSSMMT